MEQKLVEHNCMAIFEQFWAKKESDPDFDGPHLLRAEMFKFLTKGLTRLSESYE